MVANVVLVIVVADVVCISVHNCGGCSSCKVVMILCTDVVEMWCTKVAVVVANVDVIMCTNVHRCSSCGGCKHSVQ